VQYFRGPAIVAYNAFTAQAQTMQTSGTPNTRRYQRVHTRMPVRLMVDLHGRRTAYGAHTLDISPHGVRVRTSASLKPGQTLQVITIEVRPSQLWSRVVWVSRSKTEQEIDAGLEFQP
jgi:hypothetical protein